MLSPRRGARLNVITKLCAQGHLGGHSFRGRSAGEAVKLYVEAVKLYVHEFFSKAMSY
jgi:hypothetical protein